ncbi:S-layer homology domain-containing protein [Clostridium sp. HMP27]|uniref:S-layer homology domain-containing protein n=1 Tax=Clostridium sp. HMP27 TaxID=1487921 RepID=UPI000AF69B80|nr:S-layer homology domain-containing protein [Clostridium sp. HMP27]
MKLKKSRVGLMLALAMLFTIIRSSLVSAETLDYSSALVRLQGLGIIDTSVTNPDNTVTRGEFIKSIVIAEGLGNTAKNSKGTTIFPDIDPNSELSGYINVGLNLGTKQGVNQGVVYGTPNGTFQADKAVSYAEACTMLVRLLGYTDSDEELQGGSWPNNYIQEASTLDLTEGILLNKSDNLTVRVQAVMLDRLFDSVMKKSSSTESDKFFSDNYYSDTTVTGKLVETLILGNSKTSDELGENQVLTDTGIYTVKRGVAAPEIGGKYKLYIDGTVITKISPKENTLVNYAVSEVSDSTITYIDENGSSQTMSLPNASAYYYHGGNIDYSAAVKAIQPYSSIILAKDSNNDNDYCVIVDPVFSNEPLIYKYDNKEIAKLMSGANYDYIYRIRDNDGRKYLPSDEISYYDNDVVYLVSDLWQRNSFIYVYNNIVYGEIKSISPNRFNPSSITLEEDGMETKNYTFSNYFNRNILNVDKSNNLLNIGNTRVFILGINGEILDIYE